MFSSLQLSQLQASLLFYAFVLGFCEIGRRQINKRNVRCCTKRRCIELLGALQRCAVMYESSNVCYDYYAGSCSTIVSILVSFSVISLKRSAHANPATMSVKWLIRRSIDSTEFFESLLLDVLGAALSLHMAQAFWMLHLTPLHASRWTKIHRHSNLRVHCLTACIVEGLAAFTDFLVESCLADILPICVARFCAAVNRAAFINVTGPHLTGMYYNPILALAAETRSATFAPFDHVIAYWIGPILGCIAACKFYDNLRLRVFSKNKME